jgi:hypothetical protein
MSDRESKACPLCKSRAERIVGLKAEAARWRDRYADAMAKLAQADELLERAMNFPPSRRSQTMYNFYPQMKAILADTPEVLAVWENSMKYGPDPCEDGEHCSCVQFLHDELSQQAKIIGKSIDDHDKLVMEKRALEVENDRLKAKLAQSEGE